MNYEHPNNTKTFRIPGHRGKEKSEKMYGWYRGKAESFRCIFVLSSLQLLCKNIGRWLSFIKSLSFDLFLSLFRRCRTSLLQTGTSRCISYYTGGNSSRIFVTAVSDQPLKIVSPQLGIYACVWWFKLRGGWPLPPSSAIYPGSLVSISILATFWCWELEFVLPILS